MAEATDHITRSFKYRLYPTARQAEALDAQLGEACDLYNAALQHRRDAWRDHGQRVSLNDQMRELASMRADGILDATISTRVHRGALCRLDRAFDGFYRRCKAGEKPGFPRFRSRHRYDTLAWDDQAGWSLHDDGLKIQAVGRVRVRLHRPLPDGADLRCLTVSRRCGRWYACIAVRLPRPEPLAPTGRMVGVDLGVTHHAALSTGELIAGPNAGRNGAAGVRRAQRRVARRKRGSNRRRKAVALLARQREREANRRRDHAHKLSRQLVDRFDTIAVEDLTISQMMRSAKGTAEQPGRRIAQKRGLNRAIADQAWADLTLKLAYKAEDAGRRLVKVPARFTSQTCAACGVVDAKSRRGVVFRCTACGHADHADVNAARNILAGGASQAPTMSEEARVA